MFFASRRAFFWQPLVLFPSNCAFACGVSGPTTYLPLPAPPSLTAYLPSCLHTLRTYLTTCSFVHRLNIYSAENTKRNATAKQQHGSSPPHTHTHHLSCPVLSVQAQILRGRRIPRPKPSYLPTSLLRLLFLWAGVWRFLRICRAVWQGKALFLAWAALPALHPRIQGPAVLRPPLLSTPLASLQNQKVKRP